MTLAILLIVAAALSLVGIVTAAIAHALQVSSEDNLAGQIRPLDIEAFRNLADPSEEAYLRRFLPAAEFRKVRRARLHALAAYVQVAGKNAALLVRMGQRALASSDEATAEAARQLVNLALLMRRNAAIVLLRILIARAWPATGSAAVPILDGYNRLSGAAMLLGRLQNPAATLRILLM